MRFLLATAIVCALAVPAAAGRRVQCHGQCPPVGIEYELSFGVEQLSLAGQTFSNTISPVDLNRSAQLPEKIAVTGRNVGALHPQALLGELHLFLMHYPHLALGGKLGVLGGNFGKEVETGSGALVNAGSTPGMLFGPEARVVFSRGPIEFKAGLSFGYREESLDVPNRWVHCKGGLCHATVSASQFFLEPRAAIGVNLSFVSIGGYVGGDVMPTGGYVAGGFIDFHLAQWAALTDLHTWSTRGLYH